MVVEEAVKPVGAVEGVWVAIDRVTPLVVFVQAVLPIRRTQ
jgi:hypothetical protein